MRIRHTRLTAILLLVMLLMALPASTACSPQHPASAATQPQPQAGQPSTSTPTASPSTTAEPSKKADSPPAPATTVSVVVAGYINHGPMQPTVRAIKDVLSKYGDKVTVTWVDLNTTQGQQYFQQHGLTAHMNVIVNGTSKYQVDGRAVDFEWFEGQQWTKQDLDAVLAKLLGE
jgi:hypothetical protein